MACGKPGLACTIGLSVPRLVEEERLRGPENVTVLHQHMVERTARVRLQRPKSVTKTNVRNLL